MIINGEPTHNSAELAATTLIELLKARGLSERRVAVEVNGVLVKRDAFAQTQLTPNDVIEIIHYVGGG